MTDERKRWFDKNGMERVEPDPRWENPDYEPVEQPPFAFFHLILGWSYTYI